MPLFDGKTYRTTAKRELERDVRSLEGQSKATSGGIEHRASIDQQTAITDGEISFAQRCGLINEQEAAAYRQRIILATRQREQAEQRERETARTQYAVAVDGFINPHEAAQNAISLEDARAIVAAREADAAAKAPQTTEKITPKERSEGPERKP